MDTSTGLSLIGVEKSYGTRRALDRASAQVPAGRVAALVGANGAGKTTLMHAAVGLLRPDAGQITVLGKSPRRALTDGAVGFVAQDRPIYRRMSVRDHLRLGAHLNVRWDMPYAMCRLERLGIGLNRQAGTLSGGEQSQLALTLALAKRPALLVLDEPAAALDPLARHDFLASVAAEAQGSGITVLWSSHDIAELELACDHLIILRAGSVVLAGDVVDLLPPSHDLAGLILSVLRDPESDHRGTVTDR
jgi:ABC-2 type transport system ATP-binding protein